MFITTVLCHARVAIKKTESGIAHLCLLATNERIICCSFIRDIISLVWLARQFHLSIGLYDEWSWVAVTKMRISCHLLTIESGRYKKIPRVERLCPLCNRSEIGDEFHYLLKCTHSSLSNIRGIFLESLYSINSNFTNMSFKALFLYIMSMCDENIINLGASYIENILNCYASEL